MSEEILFEEPPPADARESYGPNPYQFMDLFLPGGLENSLPVVFFIHGGFWKSQFNLSHAAHLCRALSKNLGVGVVSIEYRRVGATGGGYPFTFQDVSAAADFLPKLAPKYKFDLTRSVAIGHSAGGHLAFWVGMRSAVGNSILSNVPQLRFTGLISLAGVVDLKGAHLLGLGGGATRNLIGGSPEEFPERYEVASPYALLSNFVSLEIKMTLIHGVNDPVVPISQSREFAEKCKAVGRKEVRFVELKGTSHFELIDPRTRQFTTVQNEIGKVLSI
jgi:acetyl esterase/lipase